MIRFTSKDDRCLVRRRRGSLYPFVLYRSQADVRTYWSSSVEGRLEAWDSAPFRSHQHPLHPERSVCGNLKLWYEILRDIRHTFASQCVILGVLPSVVS